MFKYSNYNIDFNDEGEQVVFNLLSSSVIKLTENKFEALKKIKFKAGFFRRRSFNASGYGFYSRT